MILLKNKVIVMIIFCRFHLWLPESLLSEITPPPPSFLNILGSVGTLDNCMRIIFTACLLYMYTSDKDNIAF